MVALEQEAYALAGQPFNLGSPKQIGDILFTKLGLPVKKKTASGAPSTDEEVLAELAADYPLPAKILEHRGFAKLKGTYTDKLPLMVNAQTGRVHTQLRAGGGGDGRLSSNDPNLQNIPIRTPEGRRVREAFVAPPGHVIASADYSQIELRIMAHISGDEGLTRAFAQGLDVHRATASEVFNVPVAEVTQRAAPLRQDHQLRPHLRHGRRSGWRSRSASSRRRRATTSSATSRALPASSATWTRPRSAPPSAAMSRPSSAAASYLPEIKGGSGPRRAGAERQAINAPMQGTAADLIKLAMIAVQQAHRRAAPRHLHRDAGARRAGVRGPGGRSRLGEIAKCPS